MTYLFCCATILEINPDEIKGEVGDDGGKKLLLPNKPSRFNFFSMVRMFKWTYYMITATVTTIRKSNTDWWRLFFLTLAFGFAHLIFIELLANQQRWASPLDSDTARLHLNYFHFRAAAATRALIWRLRFKWAFVKALILRRYLKLKNWTLPLDGK